MLVRQLIGQQAGEVHDFPVPAARAMLADGRALAADAPYPVSAPAAVPLTTAQVAAREDRNIPRHKRRAQR